MAKRIYRIVLISLATLAAYLVLGIVISDYVFPPEKADLADYFRPGDKLNSRTEGFYQTVLGVNDGWLHTRLEVAPYAPGPPEHFHEAFAESFTVKSGTVSILIDGEKRVLRAGETITVPPMTRHKPFNETGETVLIESENQNTLPLQFGYVLSQLYGFMDSMPNGPTTPTMLMQLSVYGNDADSWIADGPPIAVQKAMRILMAPTARILGYKGYYKEYKPTRSD